MIIIIASLFCGHSYAWNQTHRHTDSALALANVNEQKNILYRCTHRRTSIPKQVKLLFAHPMCSAIYRFFSFREACSFYRDNMQIKLLDENICTRRKSYRIMLVFLDLRDSHEETQPIQCAVFYQWCDSNVYQTDKTTSRGHKYSVCPYTVRVCDRTLLWGPIDHSSHANTYTPNKTHIDSTVHVFEFVIRPRSGARGNDRHEQNKNHNS